MHTQEQVEIHYEVVINEEEQYSIWPAIKEIPAGWKAVGCRAIKSECLSYIKSVWTDMRPLSLRKQMESLKNDPPIQKQDELEELYENSISPTVKFLSTGLHALTIFPSSMTIEQFKSSIKEQFIHINFTDTKGETCVGVNLDPQLTDHVDTDFDTKFHLEGDLVLDYVKVHCVVDIDPSSLKGVGYLKIKE